MTPSIGPLCPVSRYVDRASLWVPALSTWDVWQSTRRQCERTSADRDFGAQLDAWTSGLGCWDACGPDDDDDMDEPDAWRDSEALDYWDA